MNEKEKAAQAAVSAALTAIAVALHACNEAQYSEMNVMEPLTEAAGIVGRVLVDIAS